MPVAPCFFVKLFQIFSCEGRLHAHTFAHTGDERAENSSIPVAPTINYRTPATVHPQTERPVYTSELISALLVTQLPSAYRSESIGLQFPIPSTSPRVPYSANRGLLGSHARAGSVMSADVVLEASDEEILLYFKINGAGLDAQTFANALLSFDELYRAMDAVANPGREIEVDFIRSDQGSIRAVIRVFTKDVKTLLRAPLTLAILPCLLGYLINKVTSDSVSIVVNDSSYIVEHGTERIILPRDAAKIIERFNREPAVRRSVRKFFSVVDSDPSVREVDFRSPKAPDKPVLPISRDQFVSLRDLPEIELSESG
jgi:hypothetical protein